MNGRVQGAVDVLLTTVVVRKGMVGLCLSSGKGKKTDAASDSDWRAQVCSLNSVHVHDI